MSVHTPLLFSPFEVIPLLSHSALSPSLPQPRVSAQISVNISSRKGSSSLQINPVYFYMTSPCQDLMISTQMIPSDNSWSFEVVLYLQLSFPDLSNLTVSQHQEDQQAIFIHTAQALNYSIVVSRLDYSTSLPNHPTPQHTIPNPPHPTCCCIPSTDTHLHSQTAQSLITLPAHILVKKHILYTSWLDPTHDTSKIRASRLFSFLKPRWWKKTPLSWLSESLAVFFFFFAWCQKKGGSNIREKQNKTMNLIL